MAYLTDLETFRDALAAELAAGDIKPSYSIEGVSVDWNSYRTSLLEQLAKINDLISQANPYEIKSVIT